MHKQFSLGKAVLYAILLLVTAFMLFPIIWMILTAIKPDVEVYAVPPKWLPSTLNWENLRSAWVDRNFDQYFLNSLIVATSTAVLSTVVGVFGGYALSRFNFPGRNMVTGYVLAIYMVPVILLALPYYLLLSKIGLLNTRLGLILSVSTYAIPFAIWVLKGYLAQVPAEVEEAAIVDGATRFGAIWWVVLPVAVPGIVATALFAFILGWDDYLFALIVINNDQLRTLPLAVGLLASDYVVSDGLMMAMGVITSLPILILYLFFQRYFISGLTSGSVKG